MSGFAHRPGVDCIAHKGVMFTACLVHSCRDSAPYMLSVKFCIKYTLDSWKLSKRCAPTTHYIRKPTVHTAHYGRKHFEILPAAVPYNSQAPPSSSFPADRASLVFPRLERPVCRAGILDELTPHVTQFDIEIRLPGSKGVGSRRRSRKYPSRQYLLGEHGPFVYSTSRAGCLGLDFRQETQKRSTPEVSPWPAARAVASKC